MKNRDSLRLFIGLSLIVFALHFSSSLNAQSSRSDTVWVYYLGGQSNMDGYGFNKDLPAELSKTTKDILIFHGNPVGDDLPDGGLGIWKALGPGHGTGFHSDGVSNANSKRFGVEIAMAHKLRELYPDQRFAFIKYSRGGTSIDSLATGRFGCWEPDYQGATGINQYDHFLKTVQRAMSSSDIDGDGNKDILVPAGIVWMQGEADASFNEEIAKAYYVNLKRLMDLMRASFHTDDLPVVLGKISDSWDDPVDGKVWDHGELVQYAQEKFARSDASAAIVRSTRYYKYSDTWHYDSKGYLDLGEKFAEALYQLTEVH